VRKVELNAKDRMGEIEKFNKLDRAILSKLKKVGQTKIGSLQEMAEKAENIYKRLLKIVGIIT
jgi:hypothetical protein